MPVATLQSMSVHKRGAYAFHWLILAAVVVGFLSHICVVSAANHIDIDHSRPAHSADEGHQHSGVHLAACNEDPAPSSDPLIDLIAADTYGVALAATQIAHSELPIWALPEVSHPPLFLLHASLLI